MSAFQRIEPGHYQTAAGGSKCVATTRSANGSSAPTTKKQRQRFALRPIFAAMRGLLTLMPGSSAPSIRIYGIARGSNEQALD